MKSFVVELKELFLLNTNRDVVSNFDQDKRRLTIPKYQREYKWKDEKIIGLLNDIKKNSKFLGNIILDQKENGYEIVDGQQRITTCMLIFIAMFNYYAKHPREQESWGKIIKPNGNYLFSNESVGDFIVQNNNEIIISISETDDIYKQNDDFQRAFEVIKTFINFFENNEQANDFKKKLFDCDFLVLINDEHEHSRPVEQLFLDINEKAQKLEVEDVFKGHCFENFESDNHEMIKNIWVDFKSTAMQYIDLGFHDVSEYIYLYLLEMVNRDLPQNLTIDGKHFLEGKTIDDTETLLRNMIKYGKIGLEFCKNINEADYRFVNLCEDSRKYSNTDDHIALKKMAKEMLQGTGSAIYQKLPLLSFLFYLNNNSTLVNSITHDQFRRIITNLYVYMKLFLISGEKKSKKVIDLSLRSAMESNNQIINALNAVKELRREKVCNFEMLQTYTGQILMFVCSIIDNYNSQNNWLPLIYGEENKHNIEHFILMKGNKIVWEDGNKSFIINDIPINFIKVNKKKSTNYLILDEKLNEELKSKDIETKISFIREWHNNRSISIPRHIEIYIDYIEQMPQYRDLKNLKGTIPTKETVKEKYLEFLEAYFKDDNIELINKMQEAFKNAFL